MSKNKESLIAWDPAWEDAVQQYKEEFRKAGMDWEGLGPHYPIGKETLYWKLQKDSLAGGGKAAAGYAEPAPGADRGEPGPDGQYRLQHPPL